MIRHAGTFYAGIACQFVASVFLKLFVFGLSWGMSRKISTFFLLFCGAFEKIAIFKGNPVLLVLMGPPEPVLLFNIDIEIRITKLP